MTINRHKKLTWHLCLFLCSAFYLPLASADACTYDDGVLAYEQGNLMRAATLLTMAKNDGDKRADAFLSEHLAVRPKVNHLLSQRELLKAEQVALNQ